MLQLCGLRCKHLATKAFPFLMFLTGQQVHGWCTSREQCSIGLNVPTVKVSSCSVRLWETFSWCRLGPLISLEEVDIMNQYTYILSDYLYPVMKHFPLTEWFHEYENLIICYGLFIPLISTTLKTRRMTC